MFRTSVVAFALICALVGGSSLQGQAPRPRVSPHETANSIVDAATITITYGRPSMRGRKIFGSLVPYGRWWMPGADEASIFKTSLALQFGDVQVPAGSYTLYTLPTEARWTLMINKMTGQFHTYYPADQDLARLPMTIERLTVPVEQLTIAAVSLPSGGGALWLDWETTRVSAPFVVPR